MKNKISQLLHSMFDAEAIEAGAICEQLEDVTYCTKHKMNHLNVTSEKANWEKAMATAERLAGNSNTFTVENMKKFQKAVDKLLRDNPDTRLYEGLSELEHFAVRRFYYFGN